jgi:deazaflavin-dependent oxidoreductase (nitroreductase family)
MTNIKKAFYRRSKIGPLTAYKLGLGSLIGKVILLLTTTGRNTGLARVTPVQYELIDGVYHIGAVFGTNTDWVRNILAHPIVQVQVQNKYFNGRAEVLTHPEEIADFIEYRLQKRPRMIGLIMKMDGFSTNPSREELVEYCQPLALVKVTPLD